MTELGFTRIDNSILEELAKIRIPGEARQLLDVILRKTWGWSKEEDSISITTFQEMTGLSRGRVCRGLSTLKQMNLIGSLKNEAMVASKKRLLITNYRFNKDLGSWKPNIRVKRGSLKKETITSLKKEAGSSLKKETLKRKERNLQKKVFSLGSAALELSCFFISQLERRGHRWPGGKKPDPQKGAMVFDRMIRLDHDSPGEIKQVLEWVNSDHGNGNGWPGWSGVIFSPENFKDKYSKILPQMKAALDKSGGCTTEPRGDGLRYCSVHHCEYQPQTKAAETRCPGATT